MEQKYWEQFMKTGEVCDYLGYKMEVYGHSEEKNTERQRADGEEQNRCAGYRQGREF